MSITLLVFSMAGIPPLSGFFAKVFVFLAGIQSNIYSLVLFAIFASSVSCFYYIRIIQFIYFTNIVKLPISYPMEKSIAFIISVSCFFIILFFLDIELIYLPVKRMILSFI